MTTQGNTQDTTVSNQDVSMIKGQEHKVAEFKFNSARFDSTATNRVKSLADYMYARRICLRTSDLKDLKQAALDSLVVIASRKGVDSTSVALLKEAINMHDEYLNKMRSSVKGADQDEIDANAAKAILSDMAKAVALKEHGFEVDWKP